MSVLTGGWPVDNSAGAYLVRCQFTVTRGQVICHVSKVRLDGPTPLARSPSDI